MGIPNHITLPVQFVQHLKDMSEPVTAIKNRSRIARRFRLRKMTAEKYLPASDLPAIFLPTSYRLALGKRQENWGRKMGAF